MALLHFFTLPNDVFNGLIGYSVLFAKAAHFLQGKMHFASALKRKYFVAKRALVPSHS